MWHPCVPPYRQQLPRKLSPEALHSMAAHQAPPLTPAHLYCTSRFDLTIPSAAAEAN